MQLTIIVPAAHLGYGLSRRCRLPQVFWGENGDVVSTLQGYPRIILTYCFDECDCGGWSAKKVEIAGEVGDVRSDGMSLSRRNGCHYFHEML